MATQAVDPLSRLGQTLVELVRDQTIQACDRLALGQSVGPDGERWRSVLSTPERSLALTALIPDIVDQTLFHLLHALDNELLPLSYRAPDGTCIPLDDVGRGEMAGWFMGSPGWRHQYSRERFVDLLSGLRLNLDDPDSP